MKCNTQTRGGLEAHRNDPGERLADLGPSGGASRPEGPTSFLEASGAPFRGGSEGGNAGPSGPPSAPDTTLIHRNKSCSPELTRTYDLENQELADEGDRGQGEASFPTRLERYGSAHQRADQMGEFLRAQALAGDQSNGVPVLKLLELAAELQGCGSVLVFRNYLDVDRIRLHAARFCKRDKLCPFCAIRRGAKLLRRYAERVSQMLEARPAWGAGACMVTFTIKNGSDLVERFDHLRRSMKTLMDRRKNQLTRGQGYTEASAAAAAVSSVEIKRGRGSQLWHPHSHQAWFGERMPDQERLRAEWAEITGDSHQVDVRPFHFREAGLAPTVDNIAPDFAEIFKYAVKFSTMTLHDAWDAHCQLRARRLVFSFGQLYGVEEPDDLTDEQLQEEDVPFIDMVYAYTGGGAYELQDVENGPGRGMNRSTDLA